MAHHQTELVTNNGVLIEPLAEGFTTSGIFKRLLKTNTSETSRLDGQTHPFVIEIVANVPKTS